ncbi:hypothetical protein KR054_007893 [Drosophila jambulina]|nr:hypothetical protein KR054_007893 [Drosophila jambulina]
MSILNVLAMRQPDEGKCHICKRIFCCGKCRQKHQFNAHAIAVREPLGVSASAGRVTEHRMQMESGVTTIYVFCPICEQRPLLLQEEMHGELLAHIESCHLPLRCRKCQRNYTHIEDLREFSKCVDRQQDCSGASTINDQTCDTEASKVTVKKAPTGHCAINSTTISTQTSPGVTPISVINMHWKAKNRITHEEFISDSVSSIRNLSSFSSCGNSSIRRSIGQLVVNPPETVVKGKVIRSTSTPLQVESVFAKPKEPITFNASNGGYVSSIYQEESSPAGENNPAQQPLQQRAWKMSGRNKMSAATPLRQVMSKSIQKAFVEHGGMLAQPAPGVIQRRVRLDLSDHNNYSAEGGPAAGGSSALDLRLSPAMRRTQSESSASGASSTSCSQAGDPSKRQLILSAQKLTTESIIITRTNSNLRETSSTVYNSCESVEIIRSTSESAELHVPPITPLRVSVTGINKKQIKFETPLKSRQRLKAIDQANADGDESEESSEHFYTPNPGTPEPQERRRQAIVARQLSGEFSPNKERAKEAPLTSKSPPLERPRPRPPLRECQQSKAFSGVQEVGGPEDDEDEVFLPTNASTRNDKKQEPSTGRLWSLMSSMMRLPASLRGDKETAGTGSGSLIRRCASIAGSLVRPVSRDAVEKEDVHPLKRKRTQTLDNQYNSDLSPSSASTSKRYRIRPRDPIERMRQH